MSSESEGIVEISRDMKFKALQAEHLIPNKQEAARKGRLYLFWEGSGFLREKCGRWYVKARLCLLSGDCPS